MLHKVTTNVDIKLRLCDDYQAIRDIVFLSAA